MNLTEYGRSQASTVARNFYDSVVSGRPLAKALILRGLPGTGKTTLVHAVAETYDCELVETNSSSERGKDSFNTFCNAAMTKSGDRQRILFFDEADGLTASQQKRLLKLLNVAKCPVFIATNSELEKELQVACMGVEVQPVRGEQSYRLTRMLALGGERLEYEEDPDERIRQALMGGSEPLPNSDWWSVNTVLLDNTKGSEPMAWDLWQSRYRKVGKDMEKYAQRALRLNLKQVDRPWSLRLRWGGPKKTAAKSTEVSRSDKGARQADAEKPTKPAATTPPPPPAPKVTPASQFF